MRAAGAEEEEPWQVRELLCVCGRLCGSLHGHRHVCVCVCVCEREREGGKRGREGEKYV